MLKTAMSALTPGKPAAATFRSELYGTFSVHGAVVRSGANGGLLIGGHALDTASSTLNPVPDLLELIADASDVADPPTGLASALAELTHGDPVVGYFQEPAYGVYTVTGFAVDAPVHGGFLVGARILTSRSGRMPGVYLVALQRFTDTNAGPGPARITRWPDTVND
ncbi:hypothetical protein [Nocardia rosealba]|uniref:hypothetical protein n=1 Tax=Nocardia rosealba TaxID=2878563 RepID=UPI001CDA2D30|nr:hypothetical protein [Nocardia rosealba]MCA2210548.1 hypothetical protein [Nocardia rosealba]